MAVRILQFGEGVFLRGFLEPMIEAMNARGFDGAVYAVKPRAGSPDPAFAARQGRYHLAVRGIADGRPVCGAGTEITCLKRVFSSSEEWSAVEDLARDPDLAAVFSNTTEAGIRFVPGDTTLLPWRLARLLTVRCRAGLPGLDIFPCELIENNGAVLRDYVLRHLEDDPAAREYADAECHFYDTLVDRIVTGHTVSIAADFPDDPLAIMADPFSLFAIQAPESLRDRLPFPAETVKMVPDVAPYRVRKIRCLNASHTAMTAAGLLAGYHEVGELMAEPGFRDRIETTLFDEILPTIPLPDAEKDAYARSVLERLANPFAHHQLAAIQLNSFAKWRVRILPVILESPRLPHYLARSLGEWFALYRRTGGAGDEPAVEARFAAGVSDDELLADESLWGMDLRQIPGLAEAVAAAGR